MSFKRAGNPESKEFLKNAISGGTAATSPIIILELLQGCRSEEERSGLRIKLESLDVLPITQAVWEQAYELGFSLRSKGLTIPTVDVIIAALALENDCTVLHQDKHYEMIASHSTLRAKTFI